MSKKKQEAPKESKPYDGILKALFGEQYDTLPQFTRHLTWFQTMLRRTTTISPEDKHKIEEVLQMEYQGYTLLKEDPVIHSLIAEGELKGKIEGEIKGKIKGKIEGEIKGLREAILDIADDLFSLPVVVHVQQAIIASQDTEQLRKFPFCVVGCRCIIQGVFAK